MEKTIKVGDQSIRLKTTAGTPLRYKMQFGKDYFSELLKLAKVLQPNSDKQDQRKTELKKHNLTELKEIAKKYQLTGLSKMNRGQVIKLIIEKEYTDKNVFDIESITFDELNHLDTTVIFNFVWVLAKTADDDIPSPLEWLDSLEALPVQEVMPEITDLLNASIKTKKK